MDVKIAIYSLFIYLDIYSPGDYWVIYAPVGKFCPNNNHILSYLYYWFRVGEATLSLHHLISETTPDILVLA
jgi:hypothetical protein